MLISFTAFQTFLQRLENILLIARSVGKYKRRGLCQNFLKKKITTTFIAKVIRVFFAHKLLLSLRSYIRH